MLFPARNERGEFLQGLKFRQTRGFERLLDRELQFNSDDPVSDFFGGAEPDLDFTHVLIVSPLRNVRCATLGTWKGPGTARVDVTKPLQTLRHAIAAKAKLPEDALEFFLTVGRDGEWILCGFEDTEDSWALSLGKTTDNIEFMLRDKAKMLDPFILVTAPDLGTCNVNLLATIRGRALRKSAIRILGVRARYWDKLDYYLYDSTRSGEDDDSPVRLKRVISNSASVEPRARWSILVSRVS